MAHRFDPKNMERLDNPARRELLPPVEILTDIGLAPGHRLLDIGAGIGYFSLPALDIVGPRGRVIAADVSAEMLGEFKKRAGARASAIDCLQVDSTTLPLPDGSTDVALMAFVLHEMEDRDARLAEVYRVLAAGGRLAVIEWKMKEPPPGPPPAERVAPDEAERLCAGAGLELMRSDELNEHHYLVLCGKR